MKMVAGESRTGGQPHRTAGTHSADALARSSYEFVSSGRKQKWELSSVEQRPQTQGSSVQGMEGRGTLIIPLCASSTFSE
jgi:hypothetical protein